MCEYGSLSCLSYFHSVPELHGHAELVFQPDVCPSYSLLFCYFYLIFEGMRGRGEQASGHSSKLLPILWWDTKLKAALS